MKPKYTKLCQVQRFIAHHYGAAVACNNSAFIMARIAQQQYTLRCVCAGSWLAATAPVFVVAAYASRIPFIHKYKILKQRICFRSLKTRLLAWRDILHYNGLWRIWVDKKTKRNSASVNNDSKQDIPISKISKISKTCQSTILVTDTFARQTPFCVPKHICPHVCALSGTQCVPFVDLVRNRLASRLFS